MKLCSKCGKNNRREGGQRWCSSCHNESMRRFRSSHPPTEEQKVKDRVRSYAAVYLKRGKIVKSACAVCGSTKVQMHHSDYSKPLQIEWLCVKHHIERHKK